MKVIIKNKITAFKVNLIKKTNKIKFEIHYEVEKTLQRGIIMRKNVKKFASVATTENNPKWHELISRPADLYKRSDDVRSPFARDYTRILHSMAYRRLKHKTQVFFNIDNDHICTRMEHVAHVESVSNTIAINLGLNTELTKAIAIGHDIGHAPFGHQGEHIIRKLSKKYLEENFWHERNGLRFVDEVELLKDNYNCSQNLNLTYAVRDGIISHCGEVDENGLKPRNELINLNEFTSPGQYQPATWEGCIVKISDKIAYVGRDIEDAIMLGFLDEVAQNKLRQLAKVNDENALNTTVIMHNLIIDICQNSSPEKGICLSDKFLEQLNEIKKYNYTHIYGHKRFEAFKKYSELVIMQLFDTLYNTYDGKHSWNNLESEKKYCPNLMCSFESWLAKYCNSEIVPKGNLTTLSLQCENIKIYSDLSSEKIYIKAILDFISGMTDRFAIKCFNELITY